MTLFYDLYLFIKIECNFNFKNSLNHFIKNISFGNTLAFIQILFPTQINYEILDKLLIFKLQVFHL